MVKPGNTREETRIAGTAKYRARGAFLKGAFSWESRLFSLAHLHLHSSGGWLELKGTTLWS
jgi:hypothetical protein